MEKRKPGTFQKGNKAAAGPHAPGSGRPAEWLKSKCRDIVDSNSLIDFLADVAGGKVLVQVVTDEGECLNVPAQIKDRLKAVEMLLDRGWGKPTQAIDAGEGIADLIRSVLDLRRERGLKE
jgi:hypothetical protein